MSPGGLFRITRPVNSITAGLAGALGYLMATGTLVPEVAFIVLTVALVTGAGNAINDYFDADIDRINRPSRPIPSGDVSRCHALVFASVLFVLGIAASIPTNAVCIAIAVANSLLLVLYAARLKSTPLAGNILVAYLAGSIFLFGGALAGFDGLVRGLPVFLITFLAMLARELLKDAEDVEGDRASGARTLPILAGVGTTCLLASACGFLAVLASFIPFFRFGTWYVAAIVPVDAVIIAGCAVSLACREPGCVVRSRATTILKAGMFASLVVFSAAAILFRAGT